MKKHRNKKFVILDIPLLIENKLYRKSDILIGVKTSKKIINNRLKQRDYNENIKYFKKPTAKSEKYKLCHFIIENNSYKNNILKQIKIIKKFDD